MFALLIADLDDRLEKREKSGIKLKRKRLFRLAYTDIASERWKGKEAYNGELREYLKKKKLEVNPRKSKIMKFRKRVRR